MIDKKLLDILACPVSKMPLIYDKDENELICITSGLAYPVRNDIPILLEDAARPLTSEEIEKYKP